MALRKPQKALKKWTEQEWQYSSDKEEDKPRSQRGRYLPEKAWKALSSGQKAATNRLKREGSKEGKQFVAQPSKIAKKVKKYRDT
jgi:primosomal protein N'